MKSLLPSPIKSLATTHLNCCSKNAKHLEPHPSNTQIRNPLLVLIKGKSGNLCWQTNSPHLTVHEVVELQRRLSAVSDYTTDATNIKSWHLTRYNIESNYEKLIKLLTWGTGLNFDTGLSKSSPVPVSVNSKNVSKSMFLSVYFFF